MLLVFVAVVLLSAGIGKIRERLNNPVYRKGGLNNENSEHDNRNYFGGLFRHRTAKRV